jgi:hypothetical protein
VRRAAGVVLLAVILGGPGLGAAHHVGTYVPKDTEVSANFKQIKFAVEAQKFEVATRLFEGGALRAEMAKLDRRLPAGLEEGLRAALRSKDGAGTERRLMVFMLFLARDLAREAERRLQDTAVPAAARIAPAGKLLEAAWRYYNLVDFALYRRQVKAALAVRLAFDDAESALGVGGSDPMKVAATGPAGPPAAPAPRNDPAAALARAEDALGRMRDIFSRVIADSAPPAPAVPAGAGAPRP